jgi:oligopeptide/dipeptide ABC transporter ATP-binding protein
MITKMNKTLNIKNLKTYYDIRYGLVKAVDKVNLKIGETDREVVGVVGESGCGKTTLARTILRLLPRFATVEGEILWRGLDLLKLSDREMRAIRGRDISMIFQNPETYLNPLMKVGEQIMEAIKLDQSVTKEEAQSRVDELLKMVALTPSETFNQYPFQMSGGMRQRIIIAIALSHNPPLIIADEPTTFLDATTQAQILDLFAKLKKETEASFLLITHNLGIVADMCDRVYIMYAGEIVEQADVFTIFDDPKHPYTMALLESMLSVDEFREEIIGIDGSVPDLINPPSGCRFHPRCKYQKPICRKKTPPPATISEGHEVYCWLYK